MINKENTKMIIRELNTQTFFKNCLLKMSSKIYYSNVTINLPIALLFLVLQMKKLNHASFYICYYCHYILSSKQTQSFKLHYYHWNQYLKCFSAVLIHVILLFTRIASKGNNTKFRYLQDAEKGWKQKTHIHTKRKTIKKVILCANTA